MAKNLGINIKIGADLKNFSSDMQNVQRQMKRTGKKMKSIGKSMTTALTLPLGLIGGAMIKLASDVEESLNKVDVAFGDSSKEVKDFSETTLKSFGIARGSALEMASTFGDMATSMGIGQGEAAKMSTKLVGLAGDLASFKNIRIDVAQTALNSIFTGETESLKKLGIVMTQANLSAFALEKGITKPIKAMSEGEKTMLRYNFILAKTKNAQGDFERTGGGAANQMRIFQEGLKELAEKFGSLVLPMFTKLVKKLNGVVEWFSGLDEGIKKTLIVVGGLVAAVGPLLLVLGQINIAVAALIPTLSKMGVAITGSLGPLGVIITVLGLVGLKIASVIKRRREHADALSKESQVINASNELQKQTNDLIHKERYELKYLLETARDETKAKRVRLDAIRRLNSINPKYISGITLENVGTKEVTISVNKYIDALKKKAKLQAASTLLTEQYDAQIKNEIKIANLEEDRVANLAERNQELAKLRDGYGRQGELTEAALQNERNAINKSNDAYLDQINLLKQKSKAISENIDKLVKAGGVEQGGTTGSDILGGSPSGGGGKSPLKLVSVDAKEGKKALDEWAKSADNVAVASDSMGYSMNTLIDDSGKWSDMWGDFSDSMNEALDNMNQAIGSFVGEQLTGLFDAIGQELAGGTTQIDQWGKQLLGSFGKFLSQMGSMVIAYGVAKLALLKSVDPATMIAAGIAMTVLGGAIKQHTSKNLASSLDGDGGGYSPPVSYNNGFSSSSGGTLTLDTVVYGQDILLSSNRAGNTVQRTRRK